jgi:hypothetical protein
MRNRLGRGVIALGTVLAVLLTVAVPPAAADTFHQGDRVCSMYANSTGFGAFCSTGSGRVKSQNWSWRRLIGAGVPFVPCRDFDVPAGIDLPAPPQGKTWSLRLTIVDYDLNAVNPPGGKYAHLERAIVPVSQEDRDQCPIMANQDRFWTHFKEGYPSPVLVINPTYTPRVNVPAYFALTQESSLVLREHVADEDLAYYGNGQFLTMRAVVSTMRIDPGDGTPAFDCLMGVDKLGGDGYDEKQDPFHQASPCKHVYKHSSADQPDGMYTVKLSVFWEVSYLKTHGAWVPVGTGTYEVNAVQRLPVQEVQAIGG